MSTNELRSKSLKHRPTRLLFVSDILLRVVLHHGLVFPNSGHPHRERWRAIGRRFKERFHLLADEEYEEDESVYPRPPVGTCHVQAVRSVSDWSHGVLTEHSIQNACQS